MTSTTAELVLILFGILIILFQFFSCPINIKSKNSRPALYLILILALSVACFEIPLVYKFPLFIERILHITLIVSIYTYIFTEQVKKITEKARQQ